MTKNEILEIVKNYSLGSYKSFIEISTGYANINYCVFTSNGKYFFRNHLQHELEDINYEMDVLNNIRSIDFPTAYPYRNLDGSYITMFEQQRFVVYDFIDGATPNLSVDVASEIGMAAANLNSFEGWKKHRRLNIINLKKCKSLINQFVSANVQYSDLFLYFEEETNFLEPYITQPLPEGLVHGDIFPDNTIFQDNKLQAVIDFEEVCVDHLLMDVAMTINGFCFPDNKLDSELLKIFLESYQKIRPLSKDEKELLPQYIQWGAHGMLSWHLTQLLDRKNAKQLARAWELANRVVELRKSNLSFRSVV
jgi:homoserine kinase type II